MINLKRNPDGSVDVPAELRDMAGYLRCIEPQQQTAAAHLERIVDELEPNANDGKSPGRASRNYGMPPECPPLPEGAVYAGQMRDYPYNTRLTGWRWYPGCSGDKWLWGEWRGMDGNPSSCDEWHYARPIDTGDKQ